MKSLIKLFASIFGALGIILGLFLNLPIGEVFSQIFILIIGGWGLYDLFFDFQ